MDKNFLGTIKIPKGVKTKSVSKTIQYYRNNGHCTINIVKYTGNRIGYDYMSVFSVVCHTTIDSLVWEHANSNCTRVTDCERCAGGKSTIYYVCNSRYGKLKLEVFSWAS